MNLFMTSIVVSSPNVPGVTFAVAFLLFFLHLHVFYHSYPLYLEIPILNVYPIVLYPNPDLDDVKIYYTMLYNLLS
jgi:hypothetical protein